AAPAISSSPAPPGSCSRARASSSPSNTSRASSARTGGMRARAGRVSMAAVVLLAIVMPAHGQDAGRAGSPTAKVVVRGAGATFPAPLYEKWIATFRKQNPDLELTYDVVGGGEGQKRFLAHAVDFGASDAALSDEQLATV